MTLIDSPEFDADAYERDHNASIVEIRDRSIAKWSHVVPLMDPLERAYVAACIEPKDRYHPRHASVPDDPWGASSGADTIASAALDLARSSGLPLYAVETAVLIILGQYLNMLDPALHGEGVKGLDHLPRWSAP